MDDFERELGAARGVLFLCSGNMVRSAFAELYARHLGCPLPVSSAATIYRNDHILRATAQALHARGVPAAWTRAFVPRHVEDVLGALAPGTLLLGMTRSHLDALERLRARGFLLARVLGHEHEILDPVLDGVDLDETLAFVARCVEALVAQLEESRSHPRS